MTTGLAASKAFSRMVGIFFGLVALTIVIATFANAPLAYDGAFFFFEVLETHRFVDYHHRLINDPLQVPVLAAAHLTDNLAVLRPFYCAGYAVIPILGLALAWLVCRSRRPSLFLWPALSICLIALPGQFSFHSEAIIMVTLLWPALLAAVLGCSPAVLGLVALAALGAAYSHPFAVMVLAFIVLVAMVSAKVQPRSPALSLGLAGWLGILLIIRAVAPLDPYEGHAAGVQTITMSLHDSVLGWPLVAVGLAAVAGLSALFPARSHSRTYVMIPLCLAGVALGVWASNPRTWANCNDYRYWVTPFSILMMSGAAIEELWLRSSPEPQLQEIRRYALPLIGAIYLVIISIQCLEWGILSRRLVNELVSSDSGCVTRVALKGIRATAMDYWPLGFYAIELQGRSPAMLLLPHRFACALLVLNGDAIIADSAVKFVRPRGQGWFDFEAARSRTAGSSPTRR